MNAHVQLMIAGSQSSGFPVEVSAENRNWLLLMLHSHVRGDSSLPENLGLTAQEINQMRDLFGLAGVMDDACQSDGLRDREALRSELKSLRHDEWQQLFELLSQHRAHRCASEVWLAKIIASGCLASGHLWQDLGLDDRQALKQMLEFNFPALARRNTQNMRWKKFFYKQLCEAEGGYVCRAPTCEQCSTYQECFGDEI